MPGYALLVGCASGGLAGVGNDLNAMERALIARGLGVTRCEGHDATRAGILAAWERLIATAEPGAPAVVYYSGRGGRAAPPDDVAAGPNLRADASELNYLVPFDFSESTPGDFRGITSVELSVLLARLTRVTANVTAIFDCSFSMHMSRDSALQVKAWPELVPYGQLRAHIDRLLEASELLANPPGPIGNVDLVRISASASDQSAYEYQGAQGLHIGLLTESLTVALAEAGTEQVSWATVLDRVRRRIVVLAPGQRPEAEGPVRRTLFGTAETDVLGTLPARWLGSGRAMLECAPLLDVQLGEHFLIMPPGARTADERTSIGTLTVDRIWPLSAQGPVTFHGAFESVPLGARAHRIVVAAPAMPVLLPVDGPGVVNLARVIGAQPLLRAAGPSEPWLAAVRLDADGRFIVEDRVGPLHSPRPADEVGIAHVLRDLNDLARASALRGVNGDLPWAQRTPVEFTWGLVRNGERSPLLASGATVHVGQPIYFSVRNKSADTVYVSLIDIGVAARVTLLTSMSPLGTRLDPGQEYVFGFDYYQGVLAGIAPTWPRDISPAYARQETVLLLVTSDPQDVSELEQRGASRGRRASPLEAVLDQIVSGAMRKPADASGPDARYGPDTRYYVQAVDFELDPTPDEGPFGIDERPSPPALYLAARGQGSVPDRRSDQPATPATVAVRLEQLIVHRNRALLGADVRVDAIVLTAPHSSHHPVYQARTARFTHIRSGEALPIDRMLLYHGPALEYLDLALWVSRGGVDNRDLGDLLAEEFAGFEMQEALAKISDTVLAVPYALAAITALSLSAVVVNVAYKLLRGTVNNVIGLYRGSMLAHENFGAGRHPPDGLRRVQELSLAFSIEEIRAHDPR